MVGNINNKNVTGENCNKRSSIQDLIGKVTFSQMIWLMLRGSLPSQDQADLLGDCLVAGVDGPQAPSIAAARMTATCGVPLNNVLAAGINMLGDVRRSRRTMFKAIP